MWPHMLMKHNLSGGFLRVSSKTLISKLLGKGTLVNNVNVKYIIDDFKLYLQSYIAKNIDVSNKHSIFRNY